MAFGWKTLAQLQDALENGDTCKRVARNAHLDASKVTIELFLLL
jgi:hypothetical protein